MSKNLAILQKCARIFSILARIALIVSIAGAVTGLAATMLWIRWNTAPAADIPAIAQLFALIDQGTYYKTLALLIDDTITSAITALWPPLRGGFDRSPRTTQAPGRAALSLHDKLKYIAQYEGRSANGQIVYLLRQCIREFEAREGVIPMPEEEKED